MDYIAIEDDGVTHILLEDGSAVVILEESSFDDSATIPFALTPSDTQVAALVDSSTQYLTLTADATDVRVVEEAGTFSLLLTASGTDEQVTGDTEVAELGFTFSATAVETVTFVDAVSLEGTINAGMTVSYIPFGISTNQFIAQSFILPTYGHVIAVEIIPNWGGAPTDDIIAEIRPDNAGVPDSTIIASATLLRASMVQFAINRLPIVCDLTPGTTYWLRLSRSGAFSAVDFYADATYRYNYPNGVGRYYNGSVWTSIGPAFTDLAFGIYSLVPASTGQVTLTASSTEVAALTEADTASLRFAASASDVSLTGDVEVATVAFSPASSDVAAFSDSGSITVGVFPAGIDVVSNIDDAVGHLVFSSSSSEERISGDESTATVSLSAASSDVFAGLDSNEIRITLTPTVTEQRVSTDASTEYLQFVVLSTDVGNYTDQNQGRVALTGSATETHVATASDFGSEYLQIIPSGADFVVSEDVGVAKLSFSVDYEDIRTLTDAETTSIIFDFQTLEEVIYGDLESIQIFLDPSGLETIYFIYEDDGEIYFRLIPAVLEVQILTAIIGIAFRRWRAILADPAPRSVSYKRYKPNKIGTRYGGTIPFVRWWHRFAGKSTP